MTYDLTPMLTTIASCSATIIAILGGFISSKLISINTEKSEVTNRIQEINEELEHFKKIYETDLYSSQKEDALHFIRENIESLIEGQPLNSLQAIQAEERPILNYHEMLPFWEKALNLLDDFAKNDHNYNSEGVPVSFAECDDDFAYETFLLVKKYSDREEKKRQRSHSGFGLLGNFDLSIDALDVADFTVGNTIFDEKNLTDNKNRIAYLELELQQKQKQEKFLKYPKGMSIGIIIFTLFAILGIVIPLLYVPLEVTEHMVYVKFAGVFMGAFSLCIVTTIIYFIWLLKQK